MNTKRNLQMFFICELFTFANQSIAGVTYRDHFDFEERYAHDECNPLYWHPLHMPDHCIEMYEKLIRSKLYNTHPFPYSKAENELYKRFNRIMKSRRQRVSVESDDNNIESENRKNTNNDDESCSADDSTSSDNSDISSSSEELDESDKENTQQFYTYTKLNRKENSNFAVVPPYKKMLDMMREEVGSQPSMPIIGMLPPFGLATFYHQPVSKKTETTIKKMSASYASDAQKAIKNYYASFFPHLNINTRNESIYEIKNNNNTKKIEINKSNEENLLKMKLNDLMETSNKNNEKMKENKGNGGGDDKNHVISKKIENGNMVTYIHMKRFQG